MVTSNSQSHLSPGIASDKPIFHPVEIWRSRHPEPIDILTATLLEILSSEDSWFHSCVASNRTSRMARLTMRHKKPRGCLRVELLGLPLHMGTSPDTGAWELPYPA